MSALTKLTSPFSEAMANSLPFSSIAIGIDLLYWKKKESECQKSYVVQQVSKNPLYRKVVKRILFVQMVRITRIVELLSTGSKGQTGLLSSKEGIHIHRVNWSPKGDVVKVVRRGSTEGWQVIDAHTHD